MKRRIIWVILSVLMALSLVLASCAEEAEEEEEEEGVVVEEEEEEEEEEGPPVKGNWWDKFGEPEYGGTIIFQVSMLGYTFDPWRPFSHCWFISDQLFIHDWTLDRKIWNFQTFFIPEEHWAPLVAESWEWTGPQTCVVNIRPGIYWQNKPPANGREFTAQDVQYHYDRMLGTGSGYTEPNPMYFSFMGAIKQATAIDKYTLVFEFKAPAAFVNSNNMMDPFGQLFVLPELVESGEIGDWKNAIGNGAHILTDYTEGTSAIFDKNPDYWGYDERYPQNSVPYTDQVKVICIPDRSTAMAALRTGKIDLLSGLSWRQAQTLENSNPELVEHQVEQANISLVMRNDHEPFTDIRVRKAVSMAIDRETIASTHYGGMVSGQPAGMIGQNYTGWCFPYEEWSQEQKDGHSYNPERARELLAEAGFPNGFPTNAVGDATADTDLMQIIKANLLDIGIDMEIRLLQDFAMLGQFTQAGKHDQMAFGSSNNPHIPTISIGAFLTGNAFNSSFVSDPTYDAMAADFNAATTIDEAKRLSRELDKLYLDQYYRADIFPISSFIAHQPYIKGYSGETLHISNSFYWSRMWVDQELKKSMGR